MIKTMRRWLKYAAMGFTGFVIFVVIIGLLFGDDDETPSQTGLLEELEDARDFQRKVLEALGEGDAASASVTGSLLSSDVDLYRRAKTAHETWDAVRSKLYALDRERPVKQFDEPIEFLTIAAGYRKDAFKAFMVSLDTGKPSEMVKYQERMGRADELHGAGLARMAKYVGEIEALTVSTVEPTTTAEE